MQPTNQDIGLLCLYDKDIRCKLVSFECNRNPYSIQIMSKDHGSDHRIQPVVSRTIFVTLPHRADQWSSSLGPGHSFASETADSY
jgi:hypothetical protein